MPACHPAPTLLSSSLLLLCPIFWSFKRFLVLRQSSGLERCCSIIHVPSCRRLGEPVDLPCSGNPQKWDRWFGKLMGLCEVTERVTRVSLQDCSGLSWPDSDRFPCSTLNQGPAALCSRKPIKRRYVISSCIFMTQLYKQCCNNPESVGWLSYTKESSCSTLCVH